MENIDQKVQDLATKALKADDIGTSWIGRIVALIVVFASVWWFKRQLAAKEKELAAAREQVELTRLRTEWAYLEAVVAKADDDAQKELRGALAEAADALGHLEREQLKYEAAKYSVEKIQRWEDLNAIAGVKP
jgi:hypothetical protein